MIETKSTKSEITVDVCSACHPLFTGRQKLVDTAGRVDKFRARVAAREKAEATKNAKAVEKSKKIMINATIGLIVVLAAYATTKFTVDAIIASTAK